MDFRYKPITLNWSTKIKVIEMGNWQNEIGNKKVEAPLDTIYPRLLISCKAS